MRSISFIILLITFSPYSFGQQNESEDFQDRKYYALFFAIDAYDEWQNLANPIYDVKTIADELKNYYGFEVEIVENYTKDELLLKLKEFENKNYNSYDQLLIYFAGHGLYDESTNQGFLVCKDSKSDDKSLSSYLSPTELSNTIDLIPAQHTLVILDACKESIKPRDKITASRRTDIINNSIGDDYIKYLLKNKTRQFITSGIMQYVPGQPGKHSPFSRKFIECIRSYGGSDKLLPLSELKGWIINLRIEPTAGSFGTNEPGSSFVLEAKY